MAIPIRSHIPRRSQLSIGKDAMRSKQTITPKIGRNGTKGVLKGRSNSGFVLRRTNTPIQTRVKANNVPILTIWPRSETGTKPANKETNTINIAFVFHGVWFLDKSENIFGSRPSLLIE